MKYLYGLVVALLLSTGIVYACAEGEVWQSEITYENGQCTETVQSWSDNHGFRPLLGRWGCENVWHGTWFGRQCHITGHIINTCVAYEQIENVGGQCVVDDTNDDDTTDGDDGSGGDEGDDNGDEGDEGGDGGDGSEQPENTENDNGHTGSSSSGNTAESQYHNLTGQDPKGLTLEEIKKTVWEIVKAKAEAWDNRNN